MRQVLVLRIHADSTLILTKALWSEVSLEDVVVSILTGHLQWLDVIDTLMTFFVDIDIHLLQSYCIIETLLVDNIFDMILGSCLQTCCGKFHSALTTLMASQRSATASFH